MSEGDLNFPSGRRKEPASFEPPPWERDQFEELARRKQEQELAQTLALTQEEVAAQEQPADAEAPAVPADAEAPAVQPGDASETGPPAASPVDEAQVELLMMGLRAEEPPADEAYWKVILASAVVLVVIGLSITTWGVVAFAALATKGWRAQAFGSALLFFGLGFTAIGGWLIHKTLRQQGVL